MTASAFFATTFSLICTSTLSAQAPSQLHVANMDSSGVTGLVDLVVQNAILVLLGAVVLMVMVWVCCVWKACATCDKPRTYTNRSFLNLLVLVAGITTFCSSCSVEQQMLMAQYPVVDAPVAKPGCPYSNHHEFTANQAFNNRYPSYGSPNANMPSVCRHCGQKVHSGR